MMIAAINQDPKTIFSMIAGGLLLAILLAIPAANWISQRMANVLSFFSRERFKQPPPLLSKGDALAMQGRVGDAFHIFREFLKAHPRDIEIYTRLIDLAFGPMQDAGLGDAIVAYGEKRLDQRGRRVLKTRRNAIVLGELYPLKHLRWRDDLEYQHEKVELPSELKGQFGPKS